MPPDPDRTEPFRLPPYMTIIIWMRSSRRRPPAAIPTTHHASHSRPERKSPMKIQNSVARVTGAHSASKAAGWALGKALRQELRAQRTELLAIHAAFIETDMARGVPGPKIAPEDVVCPAIAALEAGRFELLADDVTRGVKLGFVAEPPVYVTGPKA